MTKKSKKEDSKTDNKKTGDVNFLSQMKMNGETKQAVFAIIFFAMAILSVLSSFHKSGVVGNKIYDILMRLFGLGYFLIPLLFFLLGISFIKSKERKIGWLKISGIIVFFISGLGALGAIWEKKGGIVGSLIAYPLLKFFDFYTSIIVLVALLVISLLIIFEAKLNTNSFSSIIRLFKKKTENEEEGEVTMINDNKIASLLEEIKENEKIETEKTDKEKKFKADKDKENEEDGEFSIKTKRDSYGKLYMPPPLSLLDRDRGKPEVGDIKANANIIKRTLQNFGIDVEMDVFV